MRRLDDHLDLRTDRLLDFLAEAGEIAVGVGRLNGDLALFLLARSVNRDARAIRTAVRQRYQHFTEQLAEFRLKRLVLQEQTYDATHGCNLLCNQTAISNDGTV